MSLEKSSYKGTRDLYPADMRLRKYIFARWRTVCERFGYEEYAAPMIEPLATYAAKSGEEIVNEQTFSFTDRGGREMAVRPEMTPSIARMVFSASPITSQSPLLRTRIDRTTIPLRHSQPSAKHAHEHTDS